MYRGLSLALIAAALIGCDGSNSSISTDLTNGSLQDLFDPGTSISRAAITLGQIELPATIEAEDYVTQRGIKIGQTSDTGGSDFVGWIGNGDYTEYTLSVPHTGTYTVAARVASNNQTAEIGFSVNDTILSNVTVNPTGGWDSWETVSTAIQLSAGDQNLRLEFTGGNSSGLMNINWFSLESVDDNPGTDDDNEIDRSNWIVSSNFNTDDAYLAIDGNDSSRWTTRSQQANGQDFYIDMGGSKTFDRIALNTTQSDNDYPQSYKVYVSSNNSNWSEVAAGTGTSNGPTVIDFADQTKPYVKISQHGSSDKYWWSIHELSMYANSSDTTETPTETPTEIPSGDDVVNVYMVSGQSNVKENWSDAIEARLKQLNSDQDSVVVMNRHPGNSFDRWWTDGPQGNFNDDLDMLQEVFDDLEGDGKEPRLSGFFWFQGESDTDSDDARETYNTRFKAFTAEFFDEMNTSNAPVAIAVIDKEPTDAGNEDMRSILFDLGDEMYGFAFDTRGYNRRDSVHLTLNALEDLGEDMADVFYNAYIR